LILLSSNRDVRNTLLILWLSRISRALNNLRIILCFDENLKAKGYIFCDSCGTNWDHGKVEKASLLALR